ncbi:unnamed protein product [Diamesa serratosioi]
MTMENISENFKPKFSVYFARLLAEVLRVAIARMHVMVVVDVDCNYNTPPKCTKSKWMIDIDTFEKISDVINLKDKIKLKEDFIIILEIFKNLFHELKTEQTFNGMIKAVEMELKDITKYECLLNNCEKQRIAMEKLKQIIKHQKDIVNENDKVVDDELNQQDFIYYQSLISCNMEKRYIHSWIQSQLCQNEITLRHEEDDADERLFQFSHNTFDENDVQAKTEKFYHQQIEEMKKATEKMNIEYHKRMEEADMKYQLVSEEKRKFDILVNLEYEQFENKQTAINEYLDFKRRRAAAKKLHDLQEFNIVIIQAWWRGELVRHFLGPFKAFKKRSKNVKRQMRLQKKGKKL